MLETAKKVLGFAIGKLPIYQISITYLIGCGAKNNFHLEKQQYYPIINPSRLNLGIYTLETNQFNNL